VTTDVEQLSCRELVELVTDYLEGALTDGERARFEDHIGLCDGCQVYLEQIRQTVTLLGSLTEESIPPQVQERLLTAFRGWKRG
jgi:anti-sigma factor RsiW